MSKQVAIARIVQYEEMLNSLPIDIGAIIVEYWQTQIAACRAILGW